MLANSSASLDAGTIRRLLHGRRRMFDSASSTPISAALADNPSPFRTRRDISSIASRVRAPARSIAPPPASSLGRSAEQARGWLNNGTSHSGVSASGCRYLMRRPGGKPPSSPVKPAPTAPSTAGAAKKKGIVMDNPHRMQSPVLQGAQDLMKQVEVLQATLDGERRDHRRTTARLEDTTKDLNASQAARQAERQSSEAQMRGTQESHKAALRQKETEMQDMKEAHDAKFHKLDAEAYARAEGELAALINEAKSSRGTARSHERETLAKLQYAKREVSESIERARRELVREKEKLQQSYEQKHHQYEKTMQARLGQYLETERRSLLAAGTSRLQQRQNYESYREVWQALDVEFFNFADHLAPLQNMMNRSAVYWSEAQRNFKPETDIHAWFPERYNKITIQIRAMFTAKMQQARESEQTWARQLEELRQNALDVRRSGHASRRLTRHHHFEDNRTADISVALCSEFLNEVPIDKARDVIDARIGRRQSLITGMPPGARREQLELEIRGFRNHRAQLTALRAAFEKLRNVLVWEAVSRASLEEQERYLLSLPIENGITRVDRAWSASHGEQSPIQDERARKDRSAFNKDRHEPKRKLRQYRRDIRMRQLLAASLGQTMSEAGRQEISAAVTERRTGAEAASAAGFRNITTAKASRISSSPRLVPVAKATRPAAAPSRQADSGDVTRQAQNNRDRKARRRKRRSEEQLTARQKTQIGSREELSASSPAPASLASSSSAGLNLKPTAAQQAAHPLWPTHAGQHESARREDACGQAVDTRNLRVDALAAESGSHAPESRIGEAMQAPTYGRPYDSPMSTSSYQHSDDAVPDQSASQSSASDSGHESGPGDLPQLQFHISQADYRSAALASKSTAGAYWTYKLYKNADGKTPPNYYCTTLEQAEARAKQFLDEPVIGFDIEWEMGYSSGRGGIKKNVSLVQIATDDKIALFHIAVFKGSSAPELMPPSLRKILESRDVVKAGVNIQGDARRMNECFGVEMVGIFELSHLYKVVKFVDNPSQINRKPFKLADQVQEVLLLPLKKDSVRTSAWSKKLDIQQTDYAASDAYAGFRLFHALEAQRKLMDPMPPRPAFWEEHKPIQLGDGTLVQAKTRKKAIPDKKAVEAEDDDENEEYFDAVETLAAVDLDGDAPVSAGVPLGGLYVSYPTLPSPEEDGLQTSMADLTVAGAEADPVVEPEEKAPKTPKAAPPPSPQVERAEQWVAEWRRSRPQGYAVKAGHYQLRAYSLWHHQGLACKDIAALLRENPLSTTTVVSYVLEAVKREGLEYDREKLREILSVVPASAQSLRYSRLVEEVRQ